MRGQVALETLMVLAALAGVLVLLAVHYGNLADVLLVGMGRKRAIYAAELLKDAMQGCPDVEIRLHFLYTIEVDCINEVVRVGKYEAEIPACSGGGKGKDVVVRGCMVGIT